MLWTDFLTLSTADAFRCFPLIYCVDFFIVVVLIPVLIYGLGIIAGKQIRDQNSLRTSLHTVPAAGAGNGFFRGNDSGDFFYKLFFLICERL